MIPWDARIALSLISFQYWITATATLVDTVHASSNCTVEDIEDKIVHLGWPQSIDCDLTSYPGYYAGDAEYNDSDYDYGNDFYSCIIWDADTRRVLLNQTNLFDIVTDAAYVIDNFTENDPLNFVIETRVPGTDFCNTGELHLEITPFVEAACEETIDATPHINVITQLHHYQEIECQVPPSHTPKVHHHLLRNHTYRWFHNCNLLPGGTGSDASNTSILRISQIDWEHLGVFTCAITHNGMTRYAANHRMCIKPKQVVGRSRLKCTKQTYYFHLNKKAVVDCYVNMEQQLPASFTFTLGWKKMKGEESYKCHNESEMKRNFQMVKCSYLHQMICHQTKPSKELQEQSEYVISIKLIFEDLHVDELGRYMLLFNSISMGHENETVMIAEQEVPFLISSAVKYAVVIACVFILALLIFLTWCKRTYIKIFWKRKVAVYELNDKRYGAYFSYHFSREMDRFAQQQTRGVISAVRAELENLGYRVFDEYKDGCESGLRAEIAIASMKDSHRVVIILTSEYLKDHWSLFTLQKGFEEMIISKSHLIFILLPGVKEYLKQRSASDDTCRMIRSAMKINDTIEWSSDEKFNSKQFSILLELAMPKLSSQRVTRHESTSSSVSLPLVKGRESGYKRTLSNETRITHVSVLPSPTDEKPFSEFTLDVFESKQNSTL